MIRRALFILTINVAGCDSGDALYENVDFYIWQEAEASELQCFKTVIERQSRIDMDAVMSEADSNPFPADGEDWEQWFDIERKKSNSALVRQALGGYARCAEQAACLNDEFHRDSYLPACQAQEMIDHLKNAYYLRRHQ